jgi:hypothetical protein
MASLNLFDKMHKARSESGQAGEAKPEGEQPKEGEKKE